MKRIYGAGVFLAVLTLTIMAQDSFIIDTGDDGNAQALCGGWWYTYNDSSNGGNSVVIPPHGKFKMDKPGYGIKGFAAHMHGIAGNKLGWDYVGMGTTLSASSSCPESQPVDLSGYRKLQFKMKGSFSGGRLILLLPYTANSCDSGTDYQQTLTEWADYETPLTAKIKPDWVTVDLDLRKDFHQPRWVKQHAIIPIETVLRNLKNLNFQYSSPDGDSIDIWVDDIVFTK